MSTPGTTIAILGAKGGVGTTTIASNLAAELNYAKKNRVLLVDLNLYLGDVVMQIGVESKPTVMQWMLNHDALENPDAMAKHPLGFSVLGLSPDLSDADDVVAEDVLQFLDRLKKQFDVVVIDCGTDLNETSLTACRYSDHRLLVTTEQRPSLMGAKRRLDILKKLDIPGETAFGVINRAHNESGVSAEAVQNAIGLQVIARIRNAWQDNQAALMKQKLLREHCPAAGVTHDYTQIIRFMRY